MAEIDEVAYRVLRNPQVVKQLGLVLGEELRDSFQFDDQRTVHDEIWDVVLLEPPALVEARQFRFRVKGNGADLKFNFHTFLVDLLG